MKFIFFILFFFSSTLGAESIFDKCEDKNTQRQLELLSLESNELALTAKLFDVYCKGESGENTLILFNDLMKDISDLRSTSNESDQTIFFLSFLSLYPQILFNLQNNNDVNDLVDIFIENMNIIEQESIRLKLEEHYSQAINILAMFVRNHMQNPQISIELINYAERMVFNSAKENFVLEGDNLPVIIYLKINKISSLILASDFESTISEINLFLKLSRFESFANDSEASIILDLLADLGGGFENRVSMSRSVSKLRTRLFELIIFNKNYDFNEDFMFQFLLFAFMESISEENSICNETIFLNLLNDKRASNHIKDHISTLCFPNKEKLFDRVDHIFQKYNQDSEYRSVFDDTARSMIFPLSDSYTPYTIFQIEEAILDIAYIFASQTSPEKSNQKYLDEVFKFCAQPENVDECMEVFGKMNHIKQSFLVDLPDEINIDNVANASVTFVVAEDIFMNDFDELQKFTINFFKNHKIIFPSKSDVIKYFDLNSASNEVNIKNFQALSQFISLYHLSHKYLYRDDDKENRLFHATIYKEFSDFFMMMANLIYELASKDTFFKTLKSQATKDIILESLHTSILARQKYEFFSNKHDFQYFPLIAIDLAIKVQKDHFDNSIYIDRFTESKSDPLMIDSARSLKNAFSSNFRINNFLTLKKDLSLDEIARLRFEQDINIRNLRDSYEYFTSMPKTQVKNFALELIENLKGDELIEYHFAIPTSSERIIFRIESSGFTQSTSYDILDEDVMKIYKEFSSYQYVNKSREGAETLSKSLHGILSYPEGIQKIYFVLDGILRFVPYHALKYKDQYLIENFSVSYLPSINSFLNLDAGVKPKTFFGIGHPKFNSIKKNLIKTRGFSEQIAFSALPETKDEIFNISKAFNRNKILIQDEATKENFLSNQKFHKGSMIYFATHNIPYGNSITDEPGLALTPRFNDQSGVLTISEISKNDFSGSLVALSACKTFDASFEDTEAYSGIAKSFFLAGAEGVYTTMWDIESISASVFNENLFENYQNIEDLPYAMHQTSKNFINGRLGDEYQDPFYWSPYIYLGK